MIAALPALANKGFPVSDTNAHTLGAMSHGLDADSAVERLAASHKPAEEPLPFAYPFHTLSTAHEAIDTAFREAFSGQLSTESPELIRQAQETARQCITELLSGNEIMRLSPEAIAEMEQSLRELAHHVTREAVKLERGAAKSIGKPRTSSIDIRRQIREQIASYKPVQDFKHRHLGWAASIEKSREAQPQSGKETQ